MDLIPNFAYFRNEHRILWLNVFDTLKNIGSLSKALVGSNTRLKYMCQQKIRIKAK